MSLVDSARLVLRPTIPQMWMSWKTRSLLIGIGIALSLAGTAFAFRTLHRNNAWPEQTDFGVYVYASHDILNGDSPYLREYPGNYGRHHAYAYPPFLAVSIIPAILVSDNFARYPWFVIQVAALAFSVTLILRGFGRTTSWTVVALTNGFIFCTYVAHGELYHGNVNFILLALAVGGLFYVNKKAEVPAGFLFGVMYALKPFLGILALFLLWRGLRRGSAVSVLTSAVLVGGSFIPLVATEGLSSIGDWLRASHYISGVDFTVVESHSAYAFAERLFLRNSYTVAWLNSPAIFTIVVLAVSVLVVISVVAALSRYSRQTSNPAFLFLEYGLFVSASMLLTPLTSFWHFYVLLPAAIGVIWLALDEFKRGVIGKWVPVAIAWLALFGTMVFPFTKWDVAYINLQYNPHGILLLWTGRLTLVLAVCAFSTAIALALEGKPSRQDERGMTSDTRRSVAAMEVAGGQ